MHNYRTRSYKLKERLKNVLTGRCTVSSYFAKKHRMKQRIPLVRYFTNISHHRDIRTFTKSLINKNYCLNNAYLQNHEKYLIHDIYDGVSIGEDSLDQRIYVANDLCDKRMEEIIVHELCHVMEKEIMINDGIERTQFLFFQNNVNEYWIRDEILARAAEKEYFYPDRRITRSITKKLRDEDVPNDYYSDEEEDSDTDGIYESDDDLDDEL